MWRRFFGNSENRNSRKPANTRCPALRRPGASPLARFAPTQIVERQGVVFQSITVFLHDLRTTLCPQKKVFQTSRLPHRPTLPRRRPLADFDPATPLSRILTELVAQGEGNYARKRAIA